MGRVKKRMVELVHSVLNFGEERECSENAASECIQMPLYSRRLKAGYLRQLPAALGLPVTASGDEIRQMIKGNLTEEGKKLKVSRFF